MSKAKDLFVDSDDEALTESLKVNRQYADKYEEVKRKQELQRLVSKFGADAAVASEDDSDSDDTDEDDSAMYLNEENEGQFAELFSALRRNDPKLLDKSHRFFSGPGESRKSAATEPKHTLRDEYHRSLALSAAGEAAEVDDSGRSGRKLKARTEEEKKVRAEFLAAAGDTSDNDAAEYSVRKVDHAAVVTTKTRPTREAYAAAADDDEKTKFLKHYFGSEAWKEDAEKVSAKSRAAPDWMQAAADDEAEAFYDDVEQWEQDFEQSKFRHEEGTDALIVQTHPRRSDGLLRRQDSTRKDARQRKREREEEDSLKAVDELKRLKALKRQEIENQRKRISSVAGTKEIKGWSQAALEKDFDPEEFDREMQKMLGDDYDGEIDDDELALIEAELEDRPTSDDEDLADAAMLDAASSASEGSEEGEDFDEDDPLALPATKANEQFKAKQSPLSATRGAKVTRRAENEALRQDLDAARDAKAAARKASRAMRAAMSGAEEELLYPTQSLEHAMSGAAAEPGIDAEALQEDLQRKVNEYWALHYEDVAGGVKTRFKYREVNPESFGFDDTDILAMDDRTLNMIAPLNCYSAYLPRSANAEDSKRASHRRRNLRLLPAERRSRRYKTDTTVFSAETPEAVGTQIAERVSKRMAMLKRAEGIAGGDTPRPPPRVRLDGKTADRRGGLENKQLAEHSVGESQRKKSRPDADNTRFARASPGGPPMDAQSRSMVEHFTNFVGADRGRGGSRAGAGRGRGASSDPVPPDCRGGRGRGFGGRGRGGRAREFDSRRPQRGGGFSGSKHGRGYEDRNGQKRAKSE